MSFQRLILLPKKKHCVVVRRLLGKNIHLADACDSAGLSDGDMVTQRCEVLCKALHAVQEAKPQEPHFWPRGRKAECRRQQELKSWLGDASFTFPLEMIGQILQFSKFCCFSPGSALCATICEPLLRTQPIKRRRDTTGE